MLWQLGGEGTLIFSYIHKLKAWPILGRRDLNIFGFFQKNEYIFGYEEIEDILGGHHKTGLFLGVISIHFRAFS